MQQIPPAGFIPAESTISGITIFKPAPPKQKHEETVLFPCPQCGGEMAYSVTESGITCAYCGYHEAPKNDVVGRAAEKFEFTVETVERSAHGWGVERKDLQCQTCGSQISLPENALTTACPFCSSNKVVQQRAPQDVLRPRFLIPFKIDEPTCHQMTRDWLGSTWLVPKELRRVAAVDTFTPIYLPFWMFGSISNAAWRAQVGHTKTYRDSKGRTRTRTEWRWESGNVRREFNDMVIRGTNHVSLHLLDQIAKYNFDLLVPYEAKYLAGMQAQAYEIGLEESWEKARHQMREETKQACRSQASTNKIRNFSMQLDFADETWRYVLLPMYINTYFYDNKPYQLLLNGQSGAIAGQRPADWRKIGWVAAALVTPGILIFLFLLLLLPEAFGAGGGFGSLLLFAIGLLVAIVIALRANKLDKA